MKEQDKSTFLIKSTKNKSFGTGFCIYKNDKGSFFLTCAHVVESCGAESIELNSYSATLLYISKDEDIEDLALLYVENFTDTIALKLFNEIVSNGTSFDIVGYRPHKDMYAQEPLKGFIKKSYQLESKSHKRLIYELSINENDKIEQGYSGSAVVCPQSGLVIAVATDRKRDGQNAYATPVTYLKDIWENVPNEVFVKNSHLTRKKVPILKYASITLVLLFIAFIGYRIPFLLERNKLDKAINNIRKLSTHKEAGLRDKNSEASKKIQREASKYAEQLDSIQDKYLNTKLQFSKYYHASFSYLMASSFSESSGQKTKYADLTIKKGKKASNLMPLVKKEEPIWFSKEEFQKRIPILLARAYILRVNYKVKNLKQEELETLKGICEWYHNKSHFYKNDEINSFFDKNEEFCPLIKEPL